jgi:hypothetical protein
MNLSKMSGYPILLRSYYNNANCSHPYTPIDRYREATKSATVVTLGKVKKLPSLVSKIGKEINILNSTGKCLPQCNWRFIIG